MARVKRAVHANKKRREVLGEAKGYYGQKSRSYRNAKQQVMKSCQQSPRNSSYPSRQQPS